MPLDNFVVGVCMSLAMICSAMVQDVELFDSRCQGVEKYMGEITVQQLYELLSQARKGRVTRENFQKFLLHPYGHASYAVAMDYSKTIEEMLEYGRYEWANSDVNDTNFKKADDDGRPGAVVVDLELVHLNKVLDSDNVMTYLDRNCMRPATVDELLAFGATYPEIQREFPIICIGSYWVDQYGHSQVPFLSRNGEHRYLNLDRQDSVWNIHCRFLAVRNK